MRRRPLFAAEDVVELPAGDWVLPIAAECRHDRQVTVFPYTWPIVDEHGEVVELRVLVRQWLVDHADLGPLPVVCESQLAARFVAARFVTAVANGEIDVDRGDVDGEDDRTRFVAQGIRNWCAAWCNVRSNGAELFDRDKATRPPHTPRARVEGEHWVTSGVLDTGTLMTITGQRAAAEAPALVDTITEVVN